MSPNAESIALADPVCGKPVGWPSPHRHVHGGALFCFCGEACRARFAAHPSRLAFIALSGGLRNAKAQAEHDAQWPDTDAQGLAPSAPMPLGDTQPGAISPRHDRQHAGAGGSLGVWRTWRERRMAARCCRELLSLYETLAADNPHLSGTSLYEGVVAAHNGCDARAARLALKEAEQSYAIWPVERDLNFRDVVHYLAVREILVADSTLPWAQADIKRIIDASIPKEL
jgi:YHS domain-containing protein